MRWIVRIIGLLLLLILFLTAYVIMTDYRPKAVLPLAVDQGAKESIDPRPVYQVAIFNIGYGGLDKDQDFFMDGGKGSKSSSTDQTLENIDAVNTFLSETKADAYMLQEVDVKSDRTFAINEKELIVNHLQTYDVSSATYYKVPYVPVPVNAPLGQVNMDMMTLTSTTISRATRYALPNITKKPDQYFHLDRCVLETVLPMENGRNLVLVNIHLSAYDENGQVKKAQLKWLENYLENTDLENHYYIIGGDWNLVMTDTSGENKLQQRDYWIEKPKDFKLNGFEWQYDPRTNTVRELDGPYEEGKTFERVIDGFLVSPNLVVEDIETIDLGFENSDHNPVVLSVGFGHSQREIK